MARKDDKGIVVGLDIGTSKVTAIVGEFQEDGEIEVIGFGMHPSKGLKKGVVVNIEATVSSIQRAVEEADYAPSSIALRTYGIGAQILRDLGVARMRLMALPRKMPSMVGFDLEVTGYMLPAD